MIGWYLHHHGRGHLDRLRAVAPLIGQPITVFSSLPAPARPPASAAGPVRWVGLDADAGPEEACPDPARADPTAGGRLHWAPLLHRGHARRLAAIAQAALGLSGLVVDVSAEAALLGRLLGLPVALFTQPGDRTDAPHRLALDLASVIIAPFPSAEALGASAFAAAAPHLVGRARAVCVGGLAPDDDPEDTGRDAAAPAGTRSEAPAEGRLRVLAVGGAGGSLLTARDLEAAAAASRHAWRLIGVPGHPFSPAVAAELAACDVAIVGAGLGSVAQLARSGRPGAILPAPRPFGEQAATARMLAELGAVVVDSPPPPAAWDGLLDRARAAGPLRGWHRPDGAAAAAAAITAACGGRP
ncbi:hypothetical protein GSY69_02575 [Brevibacterium sp. 5221]|uniref:Glycosyl transferase family 28 C-terminal domain-containing protein n=1 Tax=Brevibacterium rongguiense TaxID=2695267 RepID=A0A6N9H4N6_9MICO|nr:hypothetical protein [Brevibacterium rongguiense]MYM18893.1 hypothetical protein [Brevibacterium rongguiense]